MTVCTLIIQNEDAEAGRLLANLFRALHFDQTTFSFASLDRLGVLNREHAEKLISAKLAGAYTPTEWDRAFRLIEDYADPPGDRGIGAGSDDSDAMMLAGLRETYTPKKPANSQAPAAQPRPRGEAHIERSRPPQRQTFTRPPNIADARVEGFERTRPPQTPNAPDAREGFERNRPPQALAPSPNIADGKVEGFERTRPPQTANVPDAAERFERNRPLQIEKSAAPRPGASASPRPLPVDKNHPDSPPRTLPPIDFPRAETTGFTRARPPEHFSAAADSGRSEPHEPPQFLIPSDSLWQTDAGNRRALPDDRGGEAAGLPARREPIINLDAPLPPENRSDRDTDRGGGHDKLMYGLLAIIVAAALAFVAVNYSLFYKPAASIVTGKPGPAASPAPATRVIADPAALSERVPLLPVSRQANPQPPLRGMAVPAWKSAKPVAAEATGKTLSSSVEH